jgi:hypothetical protein
MARKYTPPKKRKIASPVAARATASQAAPAAVCPPAVLYSPSSRG